MPRFIATQKRELVIDAPSAAQARAIAEAGFRQQLKPSDIGPGMSVSNIGNITLKVEKAE